MIHSKHVAQGLAYSKCSIKGDVAAYMVTGRGGGGFSVESEDRAHPHGCGGSSPWEGSPGAQGCLGIMGPGQALSRMCSSLLRRLAGWRSWARRRDGPPGRARKV